MVKVDVKLINPFIAGTVKGLEMMAMCKPERKRVYLKENYKLIGDVTGVMGLSGDVGGAIVVSFTAAAACKVVSNMLGEEINEVNADVKDAIGEIVNLIAGQAKTALVDTEYKFKISIPTVIIGSGHEIVHQKGAPCIVAEFEIEGHPFTVEVSIAPMRK